MAAPVPIDAGWALWGKNQGTRIDYSVLACSAEPLSEAEFTYVLSHFVAGTPSAEPNRPDSLPWVIISRVGVADRPYLGISMEASAGTKDAAGRPIISTSYFCIPYAAISGAPVTYSGLYKQLDQDVRLPYRDDGLIPVSVPRLDPGGLARDVEELGEPVVAATAAMLLSGPVSIVGAETMELAERLAFIDAVAALLPCGYRTAFTAATWSDSGTRHSIRLAFASRPRQNAGVIRWKAGPATPLTGASEEYLTQYQRIRDRLRETDTAGRSEQLTKLISALARDAAPCGWDQPERALQALRDFNLPFDVHAAVRAGSVDSATGSVKSADVRRVFTESRIDELEPDQRLEVLAELIATAHREPANWPVADDWWEHVTHGDALPLLPRILRTVHDLFQKSAPSVTIREYLTRAATHGILDPLLAGLVAEPGAGPWASRMPRAQAVAEQVADSVSAEPGPAAFPQAQQALVGHPLIASLLLAHLAGVQRELEPVLTWLEPVLGETLAPFRTVLSHAPGIVSQHDIGALAGSDAGCVAALLTAANVRGRLDLVLPGFTSWLGRVRLGPSPADPDTIRSWRDYAVAVRPSAPGTQAQLDLVLLITGDPPRFLLERRDNASQRRYNEDATRAWAVLAEDLGPAGDKALTKSMWEFLTGGSWARDGAQAAAVVGLVDLLTRDGRRRSLRTAVEDVLTRTPAARRWSFTRDLLPAAPHPRSSPADLPAAPESHRRAVEGRAPASEGRQQQHVPESSRFESNDAHQSAESYDWRARNQQEYPAPKTYQPHTEPEDEPARAATSRPDTGRAKPAAAGNTLGADATAAEVAGYCTRAFSGRRPLSDVMKALSQPGVIYSGAQAADVIDELQRSLLSLSGQWPEAAKWLEQLTTCFADGSFGRETADDFRALMVRSSIEGITRHIHVLRIVVEKEEHGLFEAHESSTEDLNRAIKSLDEIRKEGKKQRSSRNPIPRLLGRQGGEGGDAG